jgi:HK97 family phage major capsid protein/HK97 family phage prohead protease
MANQIITFSADLTANLEERTISGKIVPMGTGEVGNTSAGRVVFENNSIELPEDPKKIKLLNQHNNKDPRGRATLFNVVPNDGIYASFAVSKSEKGTQSLIMAEEGLISGLSVGVEVITAKNKSGVMYVSAAKLFEVSLVTEPAFKSAQVIDVAASEEELPEVVDVPLPTESETAVENTPETVAAPVEAAAVEAARPTVAVTNVRERTAPITSAQYLGASIKAAMGDHDSRRIIEAADDSTATNTGLTLPAHLTNFVTTTFSGRPAFDAVTRAGTVPQLSFTVPKMGTAPTSAVTAEGAAPSETGMTSSYDTVTASKYSSINRVSFELLDFSNPAFEQLLLNEMRKGYEKATDEALIAAFTTSGVQATGVAATAAGLQSYIATQSAAAYKGTGGDYARKLVASTDQWAAIQGYADTTGRALYNAQGATYNASGVAGGSSVVGSVLGTDLVIDHNIAVSGIVDESAFLVAPESVYVWESPTTNLRVNVLTTGEVEINMYAYLAIYVAKGGAGVRRYNLA